MTSQAGNSRYRSNRAFARSRGLTLIELVLVLALLSTVFALAAPSLSRFFRGRTLDSEAKRFLSLTRFAQSRAVSEGLPMVLWIDEEQKTYGVQAAAGFLEWDTNALEFALADRLSLEVAAAPASSAVSPWGFRTTPGTLHLDNAVNTTHGAASLPAIRFQPDGFVGENSPESVSIREGEEAVIRITQTANRMSYAIQTDQPVSRRQ